MAGTQTLSTKTKIIIIGVILLIVLIIGFLIFRAGRKKGSVNVSSPIIDNPGNPSQNNTVVIPTASLDMLAERIYDDMSGPNLTHNTDLWANEVLTLSDTDFARLYNSFNSRYQKDSEQTFAQWITNETDYYVPFAGTQWGTIKNTLLARLSKLNLV